MIKIDAFIKQNIKHICIVLITIVLLPIIIHISYSSLSMTERISSVITVLLFLILSFAGTLLVLGFQVLNPVCPRKWLRMFCYFFIFSGIFFLLIGLIMQILVIFDKTDMVIIDSNYFLIGIITASYLIKQKYCSDLDEAKSEKLTEKTKQSPELRETLKDTSNEEINMIYSEPQKTPISRSNKVVAYVIIGIGIFALFMLCMSTCSSNIQNDVNPIKSNFVNQYNTGNPALETEYHNSFTNFSSKEQSKDILVQHFKEYGKIKACQSVKLSYAKYGSSSDKRYPHGSYINVVYKVQYEKEGKADYLKLTCVKTNSDQSFKILKFSFDTVEPQKDD